MIDIFSKYLPNWVIEAKLFPPEEKKNADDFQDCWIARNTNNFTLKVINKGKQYYLRREIVKEYLRTDLKKTRVFPCQHSPLCLNPFHFYLQTKTPKYHKKSKVFLRKNNLSNKLIEQEIKEIVNLFMSTELTQKEIGQKFGIKQQSVSYIIKHYLRKN